MGSESGFIADHQGLRDGSGLPWGVESAERAGCADRPFDLLCHRLNREPSQRQRRDEDLERQTARVQAADYGVYGARKVRLAPNRAASRGQMHRGALTAELGLFGAMRGKAPKTTIAESGGRPPPGRSRWAPVWTAGTESVWAADLSYLSYLCRCR